MYFLVGRYLPFKVLNIRIKKEEEEGWSLKCKTTNRTEVEGKCSSKIFDHSWFFTHLVKLIREYTSWILLTPALLVNILFFPPKNLEKIRVFVSRMLWLFNVYFSTTPVWKWLNFPAKRQKKKNTGAQNTHAPLFFFKLRYFLPAIK